MLFESTKLQQIVHIQRIYTIHYYEYDCDFQFEGESHDFWEFAYVDKGQAIFTQGEQKLCLEQGFAMLHRPGIFHSVRSSGHTGLNLFVITFDCLAEELSALCELPFTVLSADRQRLSTILSEARQAFSSPLDQHYFKLRRRKHAPLGAEQLIKLELEILLLHLLRHKNLPQGLLPGTQNNPGHPAEGVLAQAIACMHQNLSQPLSIDEICRLCFISRSKLQRLFRQHANQSALNYYIGLRVEAAKDMMQSRRHSYSEIADTLGFSSIHYFSKQFKQVTGMTPTEYSASLRSLSDRKSC